ncbi:PREDICTED: C2 and GRAM domain-containing protein At5g50170 [Ipomoea nil]|uniref:C2 and GRAM domain-containing protein At5g50170 n=1 Tax=Ipomoea nil TaxID=35883 RepID=UPI000901C84A|nr:PREDICTED: C2 and GRAM domain-containing protein At5g50170 [Ipomoea nil]
MRLFVYLLEGRNLGVKDSYVKLQLGKFKSKTRILKNTTDPVWKEEFVFRAGELGEELILSVYEHNGDSGLFNGSGDLVGRVKIPIWSVVAEENQNLPPTWFSLQRPKNGKSIDRDDGKILLTLSLHGKGHDLSTNHACFVQPSVGSETSKDVDAIKVSSPKKVLEGKQLIKSIAGHLEKLFDKNEESSKSNEEGSKKDNSSELSSIPSDYEDNVQETTRSQTQSFCEAIKLLQSRTEGREMPENLQGGILLDQTYALPPKDFNMLLFAPDSQFRRELAELQGTKDVQEGPWTWKSDNKSCLTRVVTYTKGATKLVKSVQATEEQTYLKGDGKEFAVLVDVSTPDVPYGSTFKVELLYNIMPGPGLRSGEESTHLVISWAVKFCKSTMMKTVIEGGTQQGLKDSFSEFSRFLAQHCKVITSAEVLDNGHLLATLPSEHPSDLELAREYFCNFTVVSTAFLVLYFSIHILLSRSTQLQGLEFHGLDLPDSVGEIITCGILVLHLEQVYRMIAHFVEARLRRGSDHGVRAHGDGWVLTVALIEGTNLASLDPTGFPDPFVVFTCNGKSRTSSVQLQTLDPQWNEILEFEPAEEPPSMLDVEVFDFDGPFDQARSLGHAEINFLKHTSAELADLWLPLGGKIAQSSQSKLHLRIFLNNNNGVETIRDNLTKMEKEVGKKLNLRSPHRNSTFQKTFGLPPEEFLINDFSCSLKRKLPLQGRIFLSTRIVGFYANLFGHKTKFFFLWEDIEEINVLPPSFSTMGSPSLVIILHKDRGTDARNGAKSIDEEGRLHFCFHSFVSFGGASRTIMALWKTRACIPDQKAQIAEEQQYKDENNVLPEETGSYLIVEDVSMSKVYSVDLPMNHKSLMEMFNGGDLEHKVMSKSGCLNYVTSSWELIEPDVYERRVSYKLNRLISIFGVEVTSTQRKSVHANDAGWILNEIMAIHGVPFSDHYQVQLRYKVESCSAARNSCRCDVYVGVMWLKNTKLEDRITKNIVRKFSQRVKEMIEFVGREVFLSS